MMIKNLIKASPILLAFAIFVPLIAPSSSHAIPAFSRTYKVECTTCHTIYPELNEYGDAFLKNSYVYFGKTKKGEKKEAPTAATVPAKPPTSASLSASQPQVSGDGDAAKLAKLRAGAMVASGDAAAATPELPVAAPASAASASDGDKSEGIILSGIPEQLPISFTGTINYAYDKSQVNELDFATRSFKLNAGGNFREKFGFYGSYVAYSEQPPIGSFNTSATSSNNKTDLNELLLSWRHILDTPINLRVGRMQPKLGLWKTNNKLSMTNNYLPYSYTVGSASLFKAEQPQDALELNAVLANRFYVAGGLVNRKGQNSKEGYGHVSYKLGGADYLANEPDVDLQKEESILDFLTLTTGAYGYYGKNGTANSNDPKNTYFRVGFDSEVLYKIFRLRTLTSYGEDDNVTPIQINSWTKVISKAVTTEAEVTMLINLIAAGRFEFLQQEKGIGFGTFANQYIRRYVGTLVYAPIENLKLALEYKFEIVPSSINRIGTLGATFSF